MKYIVRYCALFFLLFAWTVIPEGGSTIPPFTDIAGRFWQMTMNGTLAADILVSLKRVGSGVMVAFGIGILLCTISINPTVRAALQLPLELMRPIPPIAWIPLTILLFGTGDLPAVAIVAIAAFFPFVLAVFFTMDSVDGDYVLIARGMGASRLEVLRHVYAPSMVPGVIVGARVGVGLGWFSVVAAEMMGAYGGLGFGIQVSMLNLDMEQFFVHLFLIGICGYAMNSSLLFLERRICVWKYSELSS